MTAPLRRYVSVGERVVHYRRAGEGPALVMLHGSPGNSEMLEGEMAALARHFTCFALDAPGFGESEALPGDALTVADLAGATAAAMAALGLPPCLVYGTHTGAAIAIELGAGWPARATGLILEGVPIFTDAETERFFKGYFAPLAVDPLGGHFTSTWVRFRDQFTWFPWASRDVTRLNAIDRPAPEDIHSWVMMFYRACKTYGPAYRAACYYGQGAVRAAEALRLPAIYTATAEDMLFPHLDRLPALKDGQRIERLPSDPTEKYAALAAFARSLPSGAPADPPLPQPPAGMNPARQFFDTADGQVFTRCYGDPAKPAVFLLHDAPGTGLGLEGLAKSLASEAFVILPDLPANGDSGAPAEDRPILDVSANAVGAIESALGLKRFTIAATGCGCAVAATLAARRDPRVVAFALEDAPTPDAAVAAAIAPEIALSPEGAHWIQAWLIVRDNQIYKPWFDGRVRAQRRTQGNFDAAWLHDQTFALMKARAVYHRLPRAAFSVDCAAMLADAAAPVSIAANGGLEALVRSIVAGMPA
jgi:pimeloyl-ACP methyl ester carboxylesterase